MRIKIRGHRTASTSQTQAGSRAISPAITPLLVAAQEGSDLIAVASSLAAAYGVQGESLDRFVTDLEMAFEAASLKKASSAMLRAVSIAWADAYAGHFEQLTCSHAATGLSSVHHLQAHVQRLTRHTSRPPVNDVVQKAQYALIVVDLPRERATRSSMSIANERLRALVPSADVVAALASNRSAALVLASVGPVSLADKIQADLQKLLSPVGPPARVWVEALPDDLKRATSLVQELTR